jgi:hypothetical protein
MNEIVTKEIKLFCLGGLPVLDWIGVVKGREGKGIDVR